MIEHPAAPDGASNMPEEIPPFETEKHRYEYSFDIHGMIAPARVARLVGNGKKVLELGSGPGSMTRVLTEVGNNLVTAVEIDQEAIEKVRPFCQSVISADLNEANWADQLSSEKFDVVLAADVLEHVYEPSRVLKDMTALMNIQGCIILSLPHASHAGIGCCLLMNNFRYSERGLLDQTHIRFFSITNIHTLIESAGLKIIHAEFVLTEPGATEFADLWSELDENSKKTLLGNPFSLVYQIVLKAVPMGAEGSAISLFDIPVEGWKNPFEIVDEPPIEPPMPSTAISITEPALVFGYRPDSVIGKILRFPGRAFRSIGRRLP